MSVRGGHLHLESMRIMWAEPHSASQVLKRDIRFTKPDLHPAAKEPCPCQVRIEQESPIDERGAVVEVADDKSKGHPRHAKRDGVIPTQLCRLAGQPCGLG